MGCWNGTCAITHAPVLHGDKVIVMLLVQQPRDFGESLCYPTAYWRPYPFYFEGEYNDYGAVENCHGPLMPLILADVQHHLFEMDQGENEYHDVPVKKEGFDIDKMFDADHEGRLSITHRWKMKDEHDQSMRLKHVIIRKEVFDQLQAEYYVEQYVPDPGGDWTKATYVKVYGDRNIRFADEYIDSVIAAENDHLGEGTDEETDKLLKAVKRIYTRDADFYRYCIEMFKLCDMTPADFTIADLVEAGDYELARKAAHQVAQLAWVSLYMNDGRYMWCPPSGAGSQNGDMTAQKLTTKLIETAAASLKSTFSDDEEE